MLKRVDGRIRMWGHFSWKLVRVDGKMYGDKYSTITKGNLLGRKKLLKRFTSQQDSIHKDTERASRK